MITIIENEYANGWLISVKYNNRKLLDKILELEEDKNDYVKWLKDLYKAIGVELKYEIN